MKGQLTGINKLKDILRPLPSNSEIQKVAGDIPLFYQGNPPPEVSSRYHSAGRYMIIVSLRISFSRNVLHQLVVIVPTHNQVL